MRRGQRTFRPGNKEDRRTCFRLFPIITVTQKVINEFQEMWKIGIDNVLYQSTRERVG